MQELVLFHCYNSAHSIIQWCFLLTPSLLPAAHAYWSNAERGVVKRNASSVKLYGVAPSIGGCGGTHAPWPNIY